MCVLINILSYLWLQLHVWKQMEKRKQEEELKRVREMEERFQRVKASVISSL